MINITRKSSLRPRALGLALALLIVVALVISPGSSRPASAASQYGGSFDGHQYNVIVFPGGSNSSELSSEVFLTNNVTKTSSSGLFGGHKTKTGVMWNYLTGGHVQSVASPYSRRLSVWWSYPDLPTGSTNVVTKWSIRGDAYRSFTETGGRRIEFRWQDSAGNWVWTRLNRDAIDRGGNPVVFQLNRAEDAVQGQLNAFGALGATSMVLGIDARSLIGEWFKGHPGVLATAALCGASAAVCTAARQVSTYHQTVQNAMHWMHNNGYGSTPTGGS